MATCSLLAAAMLPGAPTILEDEYFKDVSAAGLTAFFDFFTEVVDLVVQRGVRITFSVLEFSSLGSFPLFIAGGLGDGNLGETGGETVEGLVLEALSGIGKANGGEDVGDFGEHCLSDIRLSKLETRLQVG